MKGFHCLAKFANFINALITCSNVMDNDVVAEGIKGLIKKVWQFLFLRGLPDMEDNTKLIGTAEQNKSWKIRFRKFGFRYA